MNSPATHLSITDTGDRYRYFGDRRGSGDVTVCEHQLNTLLEFAPEEDFDPETDIHQAPRCRVLNVVVLERDSPELPNSSYLQPIEARSHRIQHLETL